MEELLILIRYLENQTLLCIFTLYFNNLQVQSKIEFFFFFIWQKKALKFKRGLEPLYSQSAKIAQKKERQVLPQQANYQNRT
jgi:hypothetical protein